MRDGLRILGLAVLVAGGLTLLALSAASIFQIMGPALGDWHQATDVRRGVWIAAGVLYMGAGLLLMLLRRWAAILFIVGAVVAAASMAYDMAAFADVDLGGLGLARVRFDIISLLCALSLTALTVPLSRRRILR